MKVLSSAVALLSVLVAPAVASQPSDAIAALAGSKAFGALLAGKLSDEPATYPCMGELEAVMKCMPPTCAKCLIDGFKATNWEDCGSIDGFCTTSYHCMVDCDWSGKDCTADAEKLKACDAGVDKSAMEKACPDICKPPSAEATFATGLRGQISM